MERESGDFEGGWQKDSYLEVEPVNKYFLSPSAVIAGEDITIRTGCRF